ECGQALDAALFEKSMPAADRVIVEKKGLGHFLTALAVVQKHESVGAPRHPAYHRAVARQRAQRLSIFFAEKAAPNHAAIRIPRTPDCKTFLSASQRVGVYSGFHELENQAYRCSR